MFLRNFMKKAKYNMKCNNNNQETIALLQTSVSEDWSEKKLTSSQNRGALPTVNNGHRTEEELRAETNTINCINKINLNGMDERLITKTLILSVCITA